MLKLNGVKGFNGYNAFYGRAKGLLTLESVRLFLKIFESKLIISDLICFQHSLVFAKFCKFFGFFQIIFLMIFKATKAVHIKKNSTCNASFVNFFLFIQSN